VIGASVALRPANIDAFYDSLTGLCNRHGFYEFGEHALLYARRADQCAAALVANVDGLSRINEAFGQLVGDVALQDVAAILRDAMREADIIARLGSDEFAVLALGADEEEIEALVDRFLAGVQHFNATGGRPYRLAVSCGVGVRRAGSGDLGSILEDADSRMHEEKRRRAT
jgi:diguanylate cyclase (GGDEF)-like protein